MGGDCFGAGAGWCVCCVEGGVREGQGGTMVSTLPIFTTKPRNSAS